MDSKTMTQGAQVRRLQDSLAIVGSGAVAFGAWTVAKAAAFLMLSGEETQRRLFQVTDEESLGAFGAFLIVLAFLDLALRAYVGLSARAEGYGKQRGPVYLVVAGLMAIANIVFIAFDAHSAMTLPDIALESYVGLGIDVTSCVTLVLMIYCALRLRRLASSME